MAFAGRIGITSILGYLKGHLAIEQRETNKLVGKRSRRFVILWSAREESLIKAITLQLGGVAALKKKGVVLKIMCTGSGEGEQRVNIKELVRSQIRSEIHVFGENGPRTMKICVLSCGPGRVADLVRAAAIESIGTKGVDISLVEDAFCWRYALKHSFQQ